MNRNSLCQLIYFIFIANEAAIKFPCRFISNKRIFSVIRFVIILFFIISFGSCNTFVNPDDEIILNVYNEFELVMQESLLSDERAIEFVLKSVNEQECQEAVLDIKKTNTFISLNIEIADVLVPDNCAPQPSFPEGSALFYLSERKYQLEINVKNIVNHKGALEVTSDSYELTLENESGLIPNTNHLYRIPQDFIWGYYQAKTTGERNKLNQFLESSDLVFTPLNHMNQGFYSYFHIDDIGNVELEEVPTEGIVKVFAFENININNVRQKVENFKASYGDLIINFSASDGTSF